MRNGLRALVLLATLLTSVGAFAQGAPKKAIFIMNYVLYGRHAPFYVALDKGYFKEAGLDVEIIPSSGSGFVVSAIDGGKADYGMVEASSLVKGIAKGAKIKAFMAFLESTPNGLASLKPYGSVKDVIGTKVGAAVQDSARSVLPIVFEVNHLDPSKITWESASNQTYISLLLSGQIYSFSAAIDADIPPLEKLTGKKPYFYSFAQWGYDGLGFLLVASNKRIAEHPDEVKKFAVAIQKGVKDALANPEMAAKVMVKYNPSLSYETVLEQWRLTSKAIDTPYVHDHGFGVVTLDRVKRTIELTKRVSDLNVSIEPDQVFATGFAGGNK